MNKFALSFFVAKRYLFAKKSHNVINLISYIGLTGVMLGSLALVVVLSVFNGFEDLTSSLYNTFDPDVRITAKQGKTFVFDPVYQNKINSIFGVSFTTRTIEENVLIDYRGKQAIALMKGVDSIYPIKTPLNNHIYEGEFSLAMGDIPTCAMGYNIAEKLGLYSIRNSYPLSFHVPKRGEGLNINNPTSSLNVQNIYTAGIFMVEQAFDAKYVFVSLSFAESLLNYSNNITAIEVFIEPGAKLKHIEQEIKNITGGNLQVKNRHEQNASLYKMMKTEKLAVYIILIFIIFILTFNISGSLFMLILEKQKDISTFRSMGASEKLIRQIFLLEGWLISIIGLIVGLILGLTLCVLQQKFGLLRVPGENFIIDAYPIKIKLLDIVSVIISVGFIGYLASYFCGFYLKKI